MIAFASINANTGSSLSYSFCWTVSILDHGPRTGRKCWPANGDQETQHGVHSWERMNMSFDNATMCCLASPSERCRPGGHAKSPIPTMLHCLNIPTPMVAPQSLSRVLPSAGSRFQWSTWCSPSRFAASSPLTPPGFQAATLRSRSTQPTHTSNEMYLALVQLSTPDIVRQTTRNSNRASMTCKPRTSHQHCAVAPKQTTQLCTYSS